MSQWKCGWGSQSLDFRAFPLELGDSTQTLEFLCPVSGTAIQIRFSNLYSERPVHISYAEVATEKEQYETITVNHFTDITLPPHAVQLSDPITQKVRAGEWIRIKMRFCGGISETACTFFDNSVCRVAHSSEPGKKQPANWVCTKGTGSPVRCMCGPRFCPYRRERPYSGRVRRLYHAYVPLDGSFNRTSLSSFSKQSGAHKLRNLRESDPS